MPTTAEITQRYVQAHANIASAITAKGGTVSAGDGFEEFPADIATIPSGSTTDFRIPLSGGIARPCADNGIVINKYWESYDPGYNIVGNCVWSDGENIYYSYNNTQLQYNKSTQTWSSKTWTGLTGFTANANIWSDGENIYSSYYSSGTSNHYVLNKSTSKWTAKTWYGCTKFSGSMIWSDGTDIYISSGSNFQYVLDKSTSTWTAKTWNNYTNVISANIWTDGTNIYYSKYQLTSSPTIEQYVLDKSTSTWTAKTWNNFNQIVGRDVWTDGRNIYYSEGNNQYILRDNDTWETIRWNIITSGGVAPLEGRCIWTDGDTIYQGNGATSQYKLTITKTDTTNVNAPSARG